MSESDPGDDSTRQTAARDPYALGDHDGEQGPEDRAVFWADAVADEIEAREPTEPVVIKGAISPSGVPHLGNVNEIMRGYFVAESLRERGYEVQQVFTTDDRDPLRKLPRKLADLDGNIVDLGEVNAGALGQNLGRPYTDVPDPFGCCDSYGEHFSNLIADCAELLGVDIEIVSTTDLYEDGSFEELTRYVLDNQERARDVLGEYQDKVDADYVPFNPICGECGKVTETVTAVDTDAGTVEYRCTDMEAGDRVIEGCGHEGSATLRDGKLPWRFEWPAGWDVLGVDFEPFGKDHAEGSWPSGVDIAENVFEIAPPVPMVYEWFTLDGEPFSSSEGHVVMVHDVLELLEPAVVRYFFSKDPSKARDFSIERLDQLVDDFDRTERLYFEDESGTDREEALGKRAYPPSVRPTVADRFDEAFGDGTWRSMANDRDARETVADLLAEEYADRVRIPYTFAAVLGMFDDPELRTDVARKEGHLADDTPEWAVETAMERVDLASEWARRTDNEFNYELKRAELPETDFDAATETALDELADFVAEGHDGETIQGEIYETAKRHDVPISDFFGAGYRLLFDESEGPQLGPFVAKLDREFVVERFRRNR
ncbi:lysine--tRNA ligase [Halomicrobium sp. LC1Hm]|uniref:lysine--tRNA ligase n=1 Tax=Halomicrobium sp. LC1Hm TaxID=2610902 RepID=UPI0012982EDC|nr:lysine--tRNA ligase [Halomicrobium sp. LC1Hm]